MSVFLKFALSIFTFIYCFGFVHFYFIYNTVLIVLIINKLKELRHTEFSYHIEKDKNVKSENFKNGILKLSPVIGAQQQCVHVVASAPLQEFLGMLVSDGRVRC